MTAHKHRFAHINGIRIHYVEQGEGPLVILAHGFPHTWFSWHHQIDALAGAGYRVVAPDLRGMGRTEAPADPARYDMAQTSGDLLGLLDHLGVERAVFCGLSFGVFAIYDLAFVRPDRMVAIIGLENPAWPHDPACSPLTEAKAIAARHFYHVHYFVDQPERAVRELDARPREFLTKVFHALSGAYNYTDVWQHPPGTRYLDALPVAPPLPWSWLSSQDMDVFVEAYEHSGFGGGINWYRAMDLRWRQRRRFEGHRNPVPFFFIGGEDDSYLTAFHGADSLSRLRDQYADLRGVAMVPTAGHMLQMERPSETSALMLDFLAQLTPADWNGKD